MSSAPVLFLPGPTQVAPEVLAEMSRPAIGHRGPEIRELIGEVERRLQDLLHTRGPVLLCTSSATAVLEAASLNSVGTGGILHLTCGAFSEKWRSWSQSHGLRTEALSLPWGQGFDPEAVKKAVAGRGFDAVALTHNETSTGVMNPLREIAAAVREVAPETLLLVDAVSSMAAVDIPFEEWGIDVLVASVQKAFALPPGFAVAAVSPRALERAAARPQRGSYLDFVEHVKMLEKCQTNTTPSTAHLFALRLQLQRIAAEGMVQREARHREMARLAREYGQTHFELFAEESFRSPTVTTIRTPDGRDPAGLLACLREQGIVLGGGYGKLKPTTFRIGHMGEHRPEDVADLLQRIDAWRTGAANSSG